MILGDKQEFALECVVDRTETDPQDYLFGHIALWAGDSMIGDFSLTVILDIPYAYFKDSLTECGQRKDPFLMGITAVEAWNFLESALYGDNSESDWSSEQLEQKYRKFCICPGFSEALDGETAFLIEGEQEERFIWRDFASQSIKELRFKSETYKHIVESFVVWYSNLIST
ncbi:Imm42 family immunity protein [Nodularia sp. UHCC 0506]|uniref:Imm42 family immunity protein n=1 Tax=Nodularia sp. UHCC 0506 TaxID=3110243 RepID=UPI002B1FAE4A|nr:Imm42 family immunity protein [Nodularia sp. UHCC 0506]MEA5516988.1 Imm42 family immunity protein [Nodularia sp. UHCC 0506]